MKCAVCVWTAVEFDYVLNVCLDGCQLQDMFVKVVDDIRLEAEQNGHNRAQIYR